MTYNVAQKIKDNYYLYSVDAQWDPVKRYSRQKRTYIGLCYRDGNLKPPRKRKVAPAPEATVVKPIVEEDRIPFRSYCFRTYDVMHKVATDARIVESLRGAFDQNEADTVLLMAIMLAADPCSLRTMEDAVEATYPKRLIGTKVPLQSQRLFEVFGLEPPVSGKVTLG